MRERDVWQRLRVMRVRTGLQMWWWSGLYVLDVVGAHRFEMGVGMRVDSVGGLGALGWHGVREGVHLYSRLGRGEERKMAGCGTWETRRCAGASVRIGAIAVTSRTADEGCGGNCVWETDRRRQRMEQGEGRRRILDATGEADAARGVGQVRAGSRSLAGA